MSVEALIKLYIGKNLRQEISQNFLAKSLDTNVHFQIEIK
jgi:hypothetical protein